MQQLNTIEGFSLYAAEQFLRTAVIIDDKIYERNKRAKNNPGKVSTPQRKSARKSTTEISDKQQETIKDFQNDEKETSWQELVSHFAKKHIVCSLYEPTEQDPFDEESDIYKLCLASDIVIIDWNLGGQPGEKALELIENIVYQSLEDIPEQLRLVLIYTSEPDLDDIAGTIYDKLAEIGANKIEPQKEDNGLSMHSTNSRVVVLGKPAHRLQKYQFHEVSENKLAERSVREFSKLASGLLQGAALLALAKIRENSRKLLSKFDESLDSAFLLHRALSLPHEEAFGHIHPLVVDELQSILHDCLPSDRVCSDALIKDWCSKKWQPSAKTQALLGEDVGGIEFITNLFLDGPNVGDKMSPLPIKKIVTKNKDEWNWTKDKSKLHTLRTIIENGHESTSHKLAILMSHRTAYGNVEKTLTLGTVLRKGEITNGEYLLCLLPICDTVRLETKRRFVFCNLVKTEDENNEKVNHVIEDGGEIIELVYTPKSFNCVTLEFEPDGSKKKVVAVTNNKNILGFPCESDQEHYKWVAQLKPAHAQRAAEQFSRDLSRVGLTESEWLRLMS